MRFCERENSFDSVLVYIHVIRGMAWPLLAQIIDHKFEGNCEGKQRSTSPQLYIFIWIYLCYIYIYKSYQLYYTERYNIAFVAELLLQIESITPGINVMRKKWSSALICYGICILQLRGERCVLCSSFSAIIFQSVRQYLLLIDPSHGHGFNGSGSSILLD